MNYEELITYLKKKDKRYISGTYDPRNKSRKVEQDGS